MTLSIVLPARNEAVGLGKTLPKIRTLDRLAAMELSRDIDLPRAVAQFDAFLRGGSEFAVDAAIPPSDSSVP